MQFSMINQAKAMTPTVKQPSNKKTTVENVNKGVCSVYEAIVED